MKTLCVVTLIVGLVYFFFGEFCLIAPAVGYSSSFDNVGKLSLDEIGIYAQLSGTILWGSSLIAMAFISKK